MSASWSSQRPGRGGPGAFERRLARVRQLLGADGRGSSGPDEDVATNDAGDAGDLGVARGPLDVLEAVLDHQVRRGGGVTPAPPQPSAERPPRLDLERAASVVVDELDVTLDALRPSVTDPLREQAEQLAGLDRSEVSAVVETWLDDVTLVEPRIGMWVQAAAGPVLELGARGAGADESGVPVGSWHGSACPMCGGRPQASVIAEESGEFMAGSPRSLVCGRCATWWPFARAVCVECGEDDSRRIDSYLVEEQRWVRVDTCATCQTYIKTFDLRQDGAAPVVPLVDDVGTLALDVWAQHRGFSRPVASLAGV